MYHLCSENKGADQLRGYRKADLRLCFRICKKPVFSRRGSYVFLVFKFSPISFKGSILVLAVTGSCHFLTLILSDDEN